MNNHITLELFASQTYLSMYAFFSRDTVALNGIAKYFMKESEEESEHARQFIDYIVKRGGKVQLQKIDAPSSEWENATKAFEASLACLFSMKIIFPFFIYYFFSGKEGFTKHACLDQPC